MYLDVGVGQAGTSICVHCALTEQSVITRPGDDVFPSTSKFTHSLYLIHSLSLSLSLSRKGELGGDFMRFL